MDNRLNVWNTKTEKIIRTYADFTTFDFDSAFVIDREKHFLIGLLNKGGKYFSRRITKTHRYYNLSKKFKTTSHTITLNSRINKCFSGLNNGTIVVQSLHTHKGLSIIRDNNDNKRLNSLLTDRKGKFLFVASSNKSIKIYSLTLKNVVICEI